jgi:hypothetical protein
LFAGGARLQENISRGLVDFSQSLAVMRHRLARAKPGLRNGRGVAAPVSGRECRVRPILPRMGLLLAPLPAGASFAGAPSGSAGLSRRHAG